MAKQHNSLPCVLHRAARGGYQNPEIGHRRFPAQGPPLLVGESELPAWAMRPGPRLQPIAHAWSPAPATLLLLAPSGRWLPAPLTHSPVASSSLRTRLERSFPRDGPPEPPPRWGARCPLAPAIVTHAGASVPSVPSGR